MKTKEQQATSQELAEHATKVMETIDEGIRSLDDVETFFEYLYQIGATHTRIPGFTADHFWVSFYFFLSFKNLLGEKYFRSHLTFSSSHTSTTSSAYSHPYDIPFNTRIIKFHINRHPKILNFRYPSKNTQTFQAFFFFFLVYSHNFYKTKIFL